MLLSTTPASSSIDDLRQFQYVWTLVGFVNVDTFYNFVTNICVESKITRVSEATTTPASSSIDDLRQFQYVWTLVGFVNVDTFYNFVTNICVESKITRVSEATKFIAA